MRTHFKRLPVFQCLWILALFIVTSCHVGSNSKPKEREKQQSLDQFVISYMKDYQIPGAAYAVVKDGKLIYQGYLGYAHLNYRVPVSDSTLFAIASMDKQVTASAVMILEEGGLVKTTDQINVYLDSLPIEWASMTIEHLLTHTSGIPDEVARTYEDRYLIEYKTEELYEHICSLKLDFLPGESWSYSDANFFLLQRIVEEVSHIPYQQFLEERMFAPLGIEDSRIVEPYDVIQNLAQSYELDSTGMLLTNIWRSVSFGPLYNDIGFTLNDFVKWELGIQRNELLTASTYEKMWTPVELNNGSLAEFERMDQDSSNIKSHYGYGWELGNIDGHRNIFHGGFAGTSIQRFPEEQLTVIVFTNLCRGKFIPDHLASSIVVRVGL